MTCHDIWMTYGSLSHCLHVFAVTDDSAIMCSLISYRIQNAVVTSYPFDSFQVSFQQAVQRKGDDVVHVLELEEVRKETLKLKGYIRGFNPAGACKPGAPNNTDFNPVSV